MKNTYNRRNDPDVGFTLIELMIVVAIIGILAAVMLPAYQKWSMGERQRRNEATTGVPPATATPAPATPASGGRQ